MKEIWTIIGVGLVLAGLILNQGWGLRADFNEGQRSLRTEFSESQKNLRTEFSESQKNLRTEFNASLDGLRADIAELRAGQADLQQRVARIEGLLQGMLPSMAFVEPAALEEVAANQP